jgi:hypothetical protein
MDWATLAPMAAIVFGAVGLQSFWIARELDDVKARISGLEASLQRPVTRLEDRLSGNGFS